MPGHFFEHIIVTLEIKVIVATDSCAAVGTDAIVGSAVSAGGAEAVVGLNCYSSDAKVIGAHSYNSRNRVHCWLTAVTLDHIIAIFDHFWENCINVFVKENVV
jgi:hypothetical protein